MEGSFSRKHLISLLLIRTLKYHGGMEVGATKQNHTEVFIPATNRDYLVCLKSTRPSLRDDDDCKEDVTDT